MSNIRELKPKPKPQEWGVLACPECGCDDITLWELEKNIIPACSECETFLDVSEYTICPITA